MKIVCATDFSPAARAALDLAVQLASGFHDSVELVHVLEDSPAGKGPVAASQEQRLEIMRGQAEEGLAAEIARVDCPNLTIRTKVELGAAVEQLRACTHVADVRLVVLGSHGRKGQARLFLGSVAEGVTRAAGCPVLVTRGLGHRRAGFAGERRLQVLVLADGTPSSEAALEFCKGLRAGMPCDLIFVQPYWREAEARRFGIEEGEIGGAPGDLRALLERELRRWVGPMPGQGALHLRVVASDGDSAEVLATEAALREPDLVVVGVAPGGPGLASRARHADRILRLINPPVVCVPQGARAFPEVGVSRIPLVRSVIVGTDLSEFSSQAIPAAYTLLAAGGGEVEICHIFERGAVLSTVPGLVPEVTLEPSARKEALAKLERLVPPEAAARGIATHVAVVEASSAVEGLLHEAERVGADLIVVASHGRSGLRRALMGSVASEVVKRAGRPVLVLYPPLR
jgi:nucleotide-binding universal stress UspA family protein